MPADAPLARSSGSGAWQKAVLYSAFDTMVLVFVLAVLGAGLIPHVAAPSPTPALALALVAASSVAAALREWRRAASDAAFYFRERKREEWELCNFPAGEVKEMTDLLVDEGVARSDADVAMRSLARYPRFFVDLMMALELRLPAPDVAPLLVGAGAGAGAAGGAAVALGALALARACPPLPLPLPLVLPAVATTTATLVAAACLAGAARAVASRVLLPARRSRGAAATTWVVASVAAAATAALLVSSAVGGSRSAETAPGPVREL
jgi:DNA damage-binding protein 1